MNLENPYEASRGVSTTVLHRRFVRRFALTGLVCALLGIVVAIPAVILLNQTYQWMPVSTFLSSMEVNGQTIENETVIAHSTAYALVLFGLSVFLFAIAKRNYRFNAKLSNNP